MKHSVVARYVAFQLPELALVAIGLVLLSGFGFVTTTVAWWLLVAWVFKEIVLFPFVRGAYEASDPGGASHLVGASAIVTSRLDPRGRVRVGPESWSAQLPAGSPHADVGTTVCVKSVEGLTLHVVLPKGQKN